MCLAVPMRVISIEGNDIVAEIDGVKREASLMIIDEDIQLGDFVVVHAGFVISKLDEKEAQITLQLMRDMLPDGVQA
ncbi:MAG: HypC/HybG/HupF family hydrogenase formation chaperone [Desulfuromonadales bacterium]|nr:HypC/HybG/HupF family hydrogenase formation chaperone [Desulfuromonadales bacterium]